MEFKQQIPFPVRGLIATLVGPVHLQDETEDSLEELKIVQEILPLRPELEWLLSALYWVANKGHLEVLQWLHTTFQLTAKDARSNNNWAFRRAAEKGHLKVLQWLHTTYGLTAEDVRSNNNYAFRYAAKNGHLQVLEWLHTTYGLTAEDARSEDNFAFRSAAKNGHQHVLQWLYTTYGITG